MSSTSLFIMDAFQRIVEPSDLWTSRLPATYQEKAPRIVPAPQGGEAWSFEGGAWLRSVGLEVGAGLGPLELGEHSYTYDTIRQGAFLPKERLNDMATDEIDVALIFPTYGMSLRHIEDSRLQFACMQAYNDGLWDWVHQADPRRLIPQALLPAEGLDDAIAELERVVKIGYRGFVFCGWPAGAGQPSAEEDPFWAACEEAGVVVGLVKGGPDIVFGVDRTGPAGSSGEPPLAAHWISDASAKGTNLAWLVLSGVLDRFPRLKVALVEAGAGWLPFYMEQLDDIYRRGRWWAHANLKHTPSEYIKRQVKATVEGDHFAVMAREDIGTHALLWASSYPGSTTTWPSSRLAIDEQFRGVPQDERRRMLGENCADLYGVAPLESITH